MARDLINFLDVVVGIIANVPLRLKQITPFVVKGKMDHG